MDELNQLSAGMACQSALQTFAAAHPMTVDDLIPVVTAFADELRAAKPQAKASAVPALPGIDVGPGFTVLADMPSIVPKAKVDVEVGEWGISLRAKGGPKDAAPPAPVILHTSNVVGVFHVTIKDKYKSGPAGLTHSILLALNNPVMVGKTPHTVLGFSDVGTAWAKGGVARLSRAIDTAALKDGASPGALKTGTDGPTAILTASDNLALLKSLLSSTFGRIGEMDRSIFVSASSDSSVKCYVKVTEGALFPLRRALVWLGKPLMVLPLALVKEIKVNRSAARTFDLDVRTLDNKVINFSMLDINELGPLQEYVSTRTLGGGTMPAPPAASGPASSSAVASSGAASVPAAAPVAAAVPDGAAAMTSAQATAPTAASSGPAVAPAAPTAPLKAAMNMNEGDSDDEGAGAGASGAGAGSSGRGRVGGAGGDDDEDSDYEDGDSFEEEEEEAYEDNEGEDEEEDEEEEQGAGAGASSRPKSNRGKTTAADDNEDEDGDGEGDQEQDEDEDDDSDLADDDVDGDVSEDELAGLLEEAGEAAAPAMRRAAAAGAGASSSSAAVPAEDEEDEDSLGPAARFALRKRRAAAAAAANAAGAGSSGPAPSSSAGQRTTADATDDEDEDNSHSAKRARQA